MMTDVLSRPDGGFIEANNGNDHRAGTINLNIKNHAQVRIRVHLIVQVSRYRGEALGLDCSRQNLFRASFYLAHFSLFPFPLTERIYDAYFNLLYRVD